MNKDSAHTSLQIDALRRMRAAARFGSPIQYFETIDSTNTVAQQLAKEGAAEGTTIIAETQTRGRGRLGRTWSSPPFRNLYMSLILRPAITAAFAPQMALVAGLATTEAVRRWAPNAMVKWPNDVVINGRKVAGILTELDAEGELVRSIVLGIGVNLNSAPEDFPPDLRDKAIGVCTATGAPIDRIDFADHLLSRLEEIYDLYLKDGFIAIRRQWERCSYLTGRHVQIDGGGQQIEGVVIGLADDGTLLLRDGGGRETRVVAGDVTVVRGYENSG